MPGMSKMEDQMWVPKQTLLFGSVHCIRRAFGDLLEQMYEFSVDKKNQLDVTFCILNFSSNSC